jgi:hypothetical protein
MSRVLRWRGVGAVVCPECGRNRSSGGYWLVERADHTTDKLLACDRCRSDVRARIESGDRTAETAD